MPSDDPNNVDSEAAVPGVVTDRGDPLAERVRAAAGPLASMVAQAEAVQRERAAAAKERGAPRWTDVFTTQFTEFSNRPR